MTQKFQPRQEGRRCNRAKALQGGHRAGRRPTHTHPRRAAGTGREARGRAGPRRFGGACLESSRVKPFNVYSK